jgi:very-short-patch-repair endonuclease
MAIAPTQVARRLRSDQTDAEQRLWLRLRDRRLCGAKFRRQVPIGPYIADFLCHDAKLIVELDGGQHAENETDLVRTAHLEAAGYRVLRFWNGDVHTNEDGVVERIREMLLIGGWRELP